MYNQELQQANFMQLPGSILYYVQLSNNYYATLAPTHTLSYSNSSTMSSAALMEMANNLQ